MSRDNVRFTLVQKDTSSSRGFVSRHRLAGRLFGTLLPIILSFSHFIDIWDLISRNTHFHS